MQLNKNSRLVRQPYPVSPIKKAAAMTALFFYSSARFVEVSII
jgi:hypothetical protein